MTWPQWRAAFGLLLAIDAAGANSAHPTQQMVVFFVGAFFVGSAMPTLFPKRSREEGS